jgi:hypothetical protein
LLGVALDVGEWPAPAERWVGNLGEWAAALATLAAVVTALWIAVRDQQERERTELRNFDDQMRRVVAELATSRVDDRLFDVTVRIRNFSPSPMAKAAVELWAPEGEDPPYVLEGAKVISNDPRQAGVTIELGVQVHRRGTNEDIRAVRVGVVPPGEDFVVRFRLRWPQPTSRNVVLGSNTIRVCWTDTRDQPWSLSPGHSPRKEKRSAWWGADRAEPVVDLSKAGIDLDRWDGEVEPYDQT